jgi:hypothetical protein
MTLENQSHRALREIPPLWRDADAGIAEVDDAKERVVGLKAN